MVAEFDAMVGEYVQAVKDVGEYENTIFIVTSDHGDMQMEHRQFYKMVPYDASSRVPMVITDGRKLRTNASVTHAVTQLIDIFPTVLTYAEVPRERWPVLDGNQMQSVLEGEGQAALAGRMWPLAANRPDFVVSQFHGDNIAMSWFLVVSDGFKLVVWGTGREHPHQLFDLTADPAESINLVDKPQHAERVKTLLSKLRSVVDFPSVAQNVAKYNYDSMKSWINRTSEWKAEMGKSSLRWSDSWNQDASGSVAAVEAWLARPPVVEACRSEKVWPVPSQMLKFV
jgi:arylsulfatase K